MLSDSIFYKEDGSAFDYKQTFNKKEWKRNKKLLLKKEEYKTGNENILTLFASFRVRTNIFLNNKKTFDFDKK